MKIQVDARNLPCPQPVIKTKKEIEKIENGIIITIVDNEVAKENVLKLANSMNCKTNDYEKDGFYYIEINKNNVDIESIQENILNESDIENKVIFISSDIMGSGNDELGKVLIKGFIYTLTECKPYPKAIIFVNSGVKLTTENIETVENLKKLEASGVEILSCGTCLDYYSLKEKLLVGVISNMYTIVEKLKEASNTISI